MKECPKTYYIVVIENVDTNRLVAAASLILEQKFIHEIALVRNHKWRMSKLMGSGKVLKDTKDRILNCICLSKLIYGCESWRMNEKMINAVESCYARL